MKALTLKSPGGLENIVLDDVADPGRPGKGEIRVAIKASSLNYHDLLVAAGAFPTEDGRILLSDGAGIVEETGEGVDEFKPGDHVVSTFFPVWPAGPATPAVGGFAHTPGDGAQGMACGHVVRPAGAFTHAPRGWTHREAATITTSGLTAWRALVVNGRLKAGETVLVQGTGGVSIAALQLAKAMGAYVIATSSSDDKLAKVKRLGADLTINYRNEPEWGRKALELTHGFGVDHVVEVGGPATLGQSLTALKVGGHIALIGLLSGTDASLPILSVLAKHARIEGLIVGSRQEQKDFVRALDLMEARPVIDQVFPYADLAAAFAHQQSGQHFGKICVEW
ncbi:zinc-dependent alcohol dehydrogenase family protein [Thauera linaloolentis]|uniref:Putative quinone oxidoreductase Tp53I3 n=1 Tax=Thauera linaloolentis (strain DSM 12138 / JCM 21573 / CCUG 41526 / CIP 105981 / IAM 15112 / NBRC 102519 / 47Lol) TaxID=1123367 RepID=N6XXT9_THAL4|nr:NAD(P)-dependent alcohol dehydrogenase [Thauera linaloolentis]ENO84085.1 putative quinone oxidoreductase Tp53I3 [Thauera linaloolentis 47Lol = DSM 12138]MCM8564338.1 NAD(P)-dependent alcohol dehydrogenase [Thauera linaloolentis]